jgi:hypothetical protein
MRLSAASLPLVVPAYTYPLPASLWSKAAPVAGIASLWGMRYRQRVLDLATPPPATGGQDGSHSRIDGLKE